MESTATEKLCNRCRETKPATDFYVLRSGRTAPECKQCCRDRARAHRISTGEAGLAKRRASYAAHKEERVVSLPSPGMRLNLIRDQKRCATCLHVKPITCFSLRADKKCRAFECRECSAKRSSEWYYANTERSLSTNKINVLRSKVILRFGARCANKNCLVPGGCTDVRALQIDHVHNDGAEERRKYGVAGPRGGQTPLPRSKMQAIYQLALEDTEGRYQLLCANCNVIKEHERRKEEYRRRKAARLATA